MNTTHEVSPRPGRLRRKITSGLLVLSLSLGMIVATATPAHAATTVTGCFAYTNGTSMADMPVTLWYYLGGQYIPVDLKYLGAKGCFTWYGVNPGAIVWMTMYTRQGGGLYQGSTNLALPGTGAVNLGTARVTCTGYCY